jgi:hypothetical protein
LFLAKSVLYQFFRDVKKLGAVCPYARVVPVCRPGPPGPAAPRARQAHRTQRRRRQKEVVVGGAFLVAPKGVLAVKSPTWSYAPWYEPYAGSATVVYSEWTDTPFTFQRCTVRVVNSRRGVNQKYSNAGPGMETAVVGDLLLEGNNISLKYTQRRPSRQKGRERL